MSLHHLYCDVRAGGDNESIRQQFLTINEGVNVELTTGSGLRALHVAAANNHVDMVQFLLFEYNDTIQVDVRDRYDKTPLLRALEHCASLEIIVLLMNHGANANAKDFKGRSALYFACSNGDHAALSILMSQGADIHACRNDGTSLMHVAAEQFHSGSETMRVLMDHGLSIMLCNSCGDTPLHSAAYLENASTIQFLVDNHANVNAQNKRGDTALHLAMQESSDVTAVRVLLSSGAKLYIQNKNLQTPLHHAFMNKIPTGKLNFILSYSKLQKHDLGFLIMIRDMNNCTALHYAYSVEHARALLKRLIIPPGGTVLPYCHMMFAIKSRNTRNEENILQELDRRFGALRKLNYLKSFMKEPLSVPYYGATDKITPQPTTAAVRLNPKLKPYQRAVATQFLNNLSGGCGWQHDMATRLMMNTNHNSAPDLAKDNMVMESNKYLLPKSLCLVVMGYLVSADVMHCNQSTIF